MIGSLLAARFVGKKPWGMSAIFFAILFVIGMVMNVVLPDLGLIISILVGAIIFVIVAVKYLKVPWFMGVVMYFAAWIINIIIGFGLAALGVTLPF